MTFVQAAVTLVLAVLTATGFFSGCNSGNISPDLAPESGFAGVSDIIYDGYTPGNGGGRFVSAVLPEHHGREITGALHASLVRRNQMTLEWEPWMADRWTVLDGGRRIDFQLKDGLHWSDGVPVTAADWEFVTDLAVDKGAGKSTGGFAHRFYLGNEAARFIAVDSHTVALELPVVHSAAFRIAEIPPLPRHVFHSTDPAEIDAMGYLDDVSRASAIPGTGPFTVMRFIAESSVVMQPNPHYFETDSEGASLPYIEEYTALFAADADMQMEMLRSDRIDHTVLRNDYIEEALEMKEKLGVELYDAGPVPETHFLAYNRNPAAVTAVSEVKNHQLSWLQNRDFRVALSHLLDRDAIIEEVASGYGYHQATFVPDGSPYYWKGAEDAIPPFDIEAGRRLLHRRGFRDRDGDGIREDKEGNRIELILRTNEENETRRAICRRFAEDARRAGIDITCEFEPFNKLVTRLVSSYDWELVVIGHKTDIDPIAFEGVLQANAGEQWEAEADAIRQEAVSTLDETVKRAALAELQRIWIREAPWVYTFASAQLHACRTRWENFFPRTAVGYGLCAILPRIYERE